MALGQNIEISQYDVNVTTGLNQPGLIHENLLGTHRLGTIYKNNDVFFQTFTNTPLSLGVGYLNQHIIFQTDGNTVIPNYTGFGELLIKQKKLIGTTDNYNPSNPNTNDGSPYVNTIAHNLDASKIVSIRIMVNSLGAGLYYAEEHTYIPGVRAAVSFDANHVYISNYPNQSQYIRGCPVTVFITYKK